MSAMLSGGSVPLLPHTLRSPEDFDKIFTLQNIFLLTKGRYASHCGVDLACQICTLCVTWPCARFYYLYQSEYLVFLYGTLLATDGTVPEAEEPG